MADLPGDPSTSATINVGDTIDNAIETVGDHDWFKVSLDAGQKVTIAVNLGTLEDSYVYLRDANGTLLAENDDGGGGRGSRLVFTAPTSGTYYIDVAAWTPTESVPDYTGTGSYKLSVSNYVAPGVGTLDEFAYQMTNGFFGGQSHHFAVTQGGTITVDTTAITEAGRTVALAALQQWSDILGINFVETSGGAQIVFDDLEQGTGAFANAVYSNGITTSATVNVALSRLNLHTYMHEIGHALGIGHTSNSNAGTAAAIYPNDAIWSNDGAAISIMSYFDNGENEYYSSRGFSNVSVRTPQVADIIAMGNLYGLSTTTRTGDTTYGFGNTSGRTAFDASVNPNVSYTILDSGGIDTLNYSGFSGNQLINLNAEAFSNIGSLVGNVVIARGTVIENAIGGSGADLLIGNAAINQLQGGGGNDTLVGGAGDKLDGQAGNDVFVLDLRNASVGISTDLGNLWSTGSLNVDGGTILDRLEQWQSIYAADAADMVALGDIAHTVAAATAAAASYGYGMYAGGGDDLVAAYATNAGGSLFVDGGAGRDRLVIDFSNVTNAALGVQTAGGGLTGTLGVGYGGTFLVTDGGTVPQGHVDFTGVEDFNVVGSSNSDSIYTGGGNDVVNGGGGVDYLDGGAGADTLNGGAGEDALDYSVETGTAGVWADLAAGFGFDSYGNQDSYSSIEDLFGSVHGDTLRGDAGINILGGGDGDDLLTGFAGSDILRGGNGEDAVDYSGETGAQGVHVDLSTGTGTDTYGGTDVLSGIEDLFGSQLTDVIIGDAQSNIIGGGNGDDLLTGAGGADILRGQGGSDRFVYRSMFDSPDGQRDAITDFNHADGDRIDLRQMDANANVAEIQGFAFVSAFTHQAGQLTITSETANHWHLLADVDGDGVADFDVQVFAADSFGSVDLLY